MTVYENNSVLLKCLSEDIFLLAGIEVLKDFKTVPPLLEELL